MNKPTRIYLPNCRDFCFNNEAKILLIRYDPENLWYHSACHAHCATPTTNEADSGCVC